MNFDFPIEKIELNFIHKGTLKIEITFNGKLLDAQLPVVITEFDDSNQLKIKFTKQDPADIESNAILDYFKVNGGNFNAWFKTSCVGVLSKSILTNCWCCAITRVLIVVESCLSISKCDSI